MGPWGFCATALTLQTSRSRLTTAWNESTEPSVALCRPPRPRRPRRLYDSALSPVQFGRLPTRCGGAAIRLRARLSPCPRRPSLVRVCAVSQLPVGICPRVQLVGTRRRRDAGMSSSILGPPKKSVRRRAAEGMPPGRRLARMVGSHVESRSLAQRNIRGVKLSAASLKPAATVDGGDKRRSTASDASGSTLSLQSDSASSSSPSLPSSASNRSSMTDQLASLELGLEFQIDVRPEDLEVIAELGAGAGGTVSKVKHVPTGATMARKIVHVEAKPSVRKQILREVQIMHDCNSPYIVSFYGAALEGPQIHMWCAGGRREGADRAASSTWTRARLTASTRRQARSRSTSSARSPSPSSPA